MMLKLGHLSDRSLAVLISVGLALVAIAGALFVTGVGNDVVPAVAAQTTADTPTTPPPPAPPAAETQQPAQPADLKLAGAQGDQLNVIGMVPLPGSKLESQIVLFFDGDIELPLAPDGTPPHPFEIAPPLRGDFQTGSNYAAFTLAPGQDLPPNEFYDIRLNPGIGAKDGRELNPRHASLRVATFAFEPQRIWLLERNDGQIVLGLLFPVDVDLGALRAHFKLTGLSDAAIPFTLERGSSERSFRLSVSGSVQTPIKLLLAAGLEDSAAQFTLAQDRTFTYPADPFFHVTGVKWGGRSDTWRDLTVNFSKPVRGEDLQWQAIFTHMPDGERIAFEVQSTGSNTSHHIRLLKGGDIGAVKVSLSKNLTGDNETHLVEDYSEVLPPAPDPLTVTGTQWGPSDNHAYVLFLRFSSPVEFEALKEHLTVVDGKTGDPVAYTIDTRSVEDSHRIRIMYPSPDGPSISLKLSDGLVAPDKTVLLEPFAASLSWSPPKLYIADANAYSKGTDGIVVRIMLDTNINVTDFQEHLSISPDVGEVRVVAENRTQYTVYGKWKTGTQYTLAVSPGVRFSNGSLSTNTAARSLTVDYVQPVLDFTNPGKCDFTMRDGSPLGVLSMGIGHAGVTVHRVFPSNVVYALGDATEEKIESRRYYGERRSTADELITKWSEKVYEGELDLNPDPDDIVQTNLDVGKWFPPDRRGVFCVVAEYKTRSVQLRATKLVTLTNIGAMSHWQNDNLVLFAHNLFTLAPLGRARVSVYSTKKQLLHMGNTDGRGIFQAGDFDPELGPPELAVIEYENDTAFLELTPRKDEIPAAADMPTYDSKAYDGYLYADRDLYRPGETAHLRWMVRTNFGDALAKVPLEFYIEDPRKTRIVTEPAMLSEFGGGGFDFTSKDTSPTGAYTAVLRVPGPDGPTIGTYPFQLEEFVPNRLKTTVTLPAETLLAGTEYPLSVKAEHLFGAGASDRKTACEVYLEKGDWKPEAWPGLTFTNDVPFTPDRVNCGEQQTDADGNAQFLFTYNPPAGVSYPLKATVAGSVFELGGRVVTNTEETTLFPSDLSLGLRADEQQGGAGVEIHVAAVKPDGSPAALDTVKVTLERQVWNYYVRRYYSNYESNWSDAYEEVETRDVPLQDGAGALSMNVEGYGRFRLRVHSEKTPQFSTLAFHSYWYGGRLSFGRGEGMSLLKLSLDKKQYRPGEKAVLLVESPFNGRGVLVVQGEKIRDMIPFEILDNKAEIRLPVNQENVPNLWLEVTALHEVQTDRAQVYPFSSFAMIPLAVENTARKLDVSFPGLPEEVRPLTGATFDILVKDGSGNPVATELTLAAVDEGIHAITDYQTPDPYGFFSRPRRPDYRRAHYYDKVAYDFDKTGFGGGARLAKRAQTIGENWIKPVALWSGVVRTDAGGKASVSVPLPEFSGQLRLVAVACSATASGAGQESIFVRRHFVLRTSMPRFMLPGDVADCAAAVFNTTDQPARAKVSWTVSGPLSAESGTQMVDLPAKGEARASARITAEQAVGQGLIQWRATITDTAGNELEDLTEDAPMPVRPSSGFQSRDDFFVLDPGATQTYTNGLFLENAWTERAISVTADPSSRLEPALKFVVDYPYGCVEQTVSRLMPMYLLRSSRDMVGRVLGNDRDLNTWIGAGVQRIFSMQTPNGGLSYWPGGYATYPYGSLYALHFLTLLKNDRQFSIPAAPYQGLQRYARTVAADWSDDSASHRYERAYALYVLALAGDAEAVRQICRFDTVEMPQPARYLLAAALAKATQDSDRVQMYLSEMPSVPYAVAEQTASLNSDIRAKAVELMALRQMGGDPEEIHARAETLIRYLELHRHGNTQESAFAVTALCEYLGELSEQLDNPSASITGPSGTKGIAGHERYFDRHNGTGGEYRVANSGQSPMFVNLTTRGFLKDPQTAPARNGVGVERAILTMEGAPHEGTEFRQTDTYIVHLVIYADRAADNMVAVDMLPAGFEIENPRLAKNLPQLDSEPDVTPSYTDLRDDRIILAFDHLGVGTYHYHYVVRAVTPGVYQYPAAAAECMYDAEIQGSSKADTITVKDSN